LTDTDDYLIWSHEHGAWWKPRKLGYTGNPTIAGRYTKAQAERICQDAAYGWREGLPSEVMIPAERPAGVGWAQQIQEATSEAIAAKFAGDRQESTP
jgi:hypothetical protein